MLAPPGVCLCQMLHLEHVEPSEDEIPPEHEDDEHVPGCPASKAISGCLHVSPTAVPDLLDTLDLLPPPCAENYPTALSHPVTVVFLHSTEPPVWLKVRALLI